MGIFDEDFEEPEPYKNDLKAVICIYHDQEKENQSALNQKLEELQERLVQEKKAGKYERIKIAFVYETPALEVREFTEITETSPIIYKEPCERSSSHKLSHVFFMGCALLEREQKKDKDDETEYRMYLLTDSDLEKVERSQFEMMFQKEKDMRQNTIRMNDRFQHLRFHMFLELAEGANGNSVMKQFISSMEDAICSIENDKFYS